MDKGIIIGVEEEVVTRSSLPFVMFKILTTVRPISFQEYIMLTLSVLARRIYFYTMCCVIISVDLK